MVSVDAIGVHVGGDRIHGALQAVEVLEGGGAAAKGACGGACVQELKMKARALI